VEELDYVSTKEERIDVKIVVVPVYVTITG
jgi:hypothetical protein